MPRTVPATEGDPAQNVGSVSQSWEALLQNDVELLAGRVS